MEGGALVGIEAVHIGSVVFDQCLDLLQITYNGDISINTNSRKGKREMKRGREGEGGREGGTISRGDRGRIQIRDETMGRERGRGRRREGVSE